MKNSKLIESLNRLLCLDDYNDVSNNGLQIDRVGDEITCVAVAVDASLETVRRAASAGAELLLVHHGISWGGGIRMLVGGVGAVVRASIEANLALYAAHLPLDAHRTLGNNIGLCRMLRLTQCKPAFEYHGHKIGFIGTSQSERNVKIGASEYRIPKGLIGVCSGGSGNFAEEAQSLGCCLFLTGEASWGGVIAAQNCGMQMICAGHYETETFGVRALGEWLRKRGLKIVDLT